MDAARPSWLVGGRRGQILVLAVLLCAGACSSIRVRPADGSALGESWRVSAVTTNGLSPRTTQTLRLWGLEELYQDNPDEALARLHAAALNDPQPDLLFALAEGSYLRGRQAEKHNCGNAIACYYRCAGYAYHYLFDEYVPPVREADLGMIEQNGELKTVGFFRQRRMLRTAEAFDPRYRVACDLYNAGLGKCIAAAQRVGQLDPRRELRLPTPDGKGFTLSVVHAGFTWRPEEFGPLLLAEDYTVDGMTNQHHTYGLGVPLIATRAPTVLQAADHAYYAPEVSFPATAFFRFEGSLADLGQLRTGRLELYNPLVIQAVEVGKRPVPLETDITTPLAYFLANSKLDNAGVLGFVNGDRIQNRTGMYLLTPYQPGKIPVVLVHGLLSSPITWAPMFNDLLGDPVLRERYQLWYYFYSTGDPYLVTAANLRRDLARVRLDLDPEHRDPALDQMVFVGHSMGGLVSKLMTVDGGDDFWRLIASEPLASLKLPPETRAELERTFYFRRVPCVKRVVYIATPHRGSKLSPSTLGRLAVKLVRLPSSLVEATQQLMTDNPGVRPQSIPTSVDLLAPGSPALELLARRPRPADVHYHTVAGVLHSRGTSLDRVLEYFDDCEKGDGVVPYTSAHLDNADSELVVPADHFDANHHPLAVQEVRRVLLEHYQSLLREHALVPVRPNNPPPPLPPSVSEVGKAPQP